MVVGYYIKTRDKTPPNIRIFIQLLEQLIIVNTVFIISLEPRVAHSLMSLLLAPLQAQQHHG
jgi:hypothetical protein